MENKKKIAFAYHATLARPGWSGLVDALREGGHEICLVSDDTEEGLISADYRHMATQHIDVERDPVVVVPTKEQSYGYTLMAEKLGSEPMDIVLIDSRTAKLTAAREAGFGIVFYNGKEDGISNVRQELAHKGVLSL